MLTPSQTGFLIMTMSSLYSKWPPQSPDLNPTGHLWDLRERELAIVDVQQLCDATKSIWSNIDEERFQHLVGSTPQRNKEIQKAQGGPT